VQVEQVSWSLGSGWSSPAAGGAAPPGPALVDPQLVLVFGGSTLPADDVIRAVRSRYPSAVLAGCSTAGEITGVAVADGTLAVTALRFASAHVRAAVEPCASAADARAAGERLGATLTAPDLAHVLVLSDGVGVHGSALAEGLVATLPSHVAVTGGLAGHAPRSKRTWVLSGDPWEPAGADACVPGRAVAIGLYGAALRVGFGCGGGWDPFGPSRVITRAAGNVIHELDGQPALALYQRYLGDQAAGLPAAGLAFPLELRSAGDGAAGASVPMSGRRGLPSAAAGGPPRVRAMLSIDTAAGCIAFAGDTPVGDHARLMHANLDRLADGAFEAAKRATDHAGVPGELAILVSCVGRRQVLGQRVEDELDCVREVLGEIPTTGFYSSGELCPGGPAGTGCELHNQTMTVTILSEEVGSTR
jgi:hypothetical protein